MCRFLLVFLVISCSSPSFADYEAEPNNSTEEAQEISFNRLYQGSSGLGDPNDFFSFNLSASIEITVRYQLLDSSYATYFSIYNSSEILVWTDYVTSEDSHEETIGLSEGTYFLRVNRTGTANQRYEFSINALALSSKTISIAGIPDINNNNSGDVAILMINRGNKVLIHIRDGRTKRVIKSILVHGNASIAEPIEITNIPDVNNDGYFDIGVLWKNLNTGYFYTDIYNSQTKRRISRIKTGG